MIGVDIGGTLFKVAILSKNPPKSVEIIPDLTSSLFLISLTWKLLDLSHQIR